MEDPTTPKLTQTTGKRPLPTGVFFLGCGNLNRRFVAAQACPLIRNQSGSIEIYLAGAGDGAGTAGGTVSISLPAKIGADVGLPSGDPPACSTVTAKVASLMVSAS